MIEKNIPKVIALEDFEKKHEIKNAKVIIERPNKRKKVNITKKLVSVKTLNLKITPNKHVINELANTK